MMDEQISRAEELARAKYRQGYNCTESMLHTFREELNLDLSDDAMKIATGFGGGLGQAGCMCGALTGAVMVISLLSGRSTPAESRDPIYANAKEFHNRFREHFGATCCRVLNPHDFSTKEQRRSCFRITGETAELLDKFLKDTGLDAVAKQAK